jgi:hypothetical protein
MSNFIIISIAFLLFACGKEEKTKTEHMHHDQQMSNDLTASEQEKVIYYTCPMEEHKHIHSSEEGKCPECDMVLVAGVVTTAEKMDYYGCPMEIHSHVRSDQSGTCDECGMELKPMRLVQE